MRQYATTETQVQPLLILSTVELASHHQQRPIALLGERSASEYGL
jgi:hypothetical protein